MSKLNSYFNELKKIAKDYSLQVDNVEIKMLNEIKMHELMQKGYVNRPFIESNRLTNLSYIPEIFIIGNPHFIYLNDQNDFELNLLSIAHALAHVDFANRNNVLKYLHKYKTRIDHELIPFVDDVIQIEGNKRVRSIVERLRTVYYYTFSSIHEYVSQIENKWYRKLFLNEESSNSVQIDIFEKIIDRSNFLKDWEKQLAQLLKLESVYFYGIKKTKLINEGWASFWQRKLLNELNLKTNEKLKLAILEAKLHKKDSYGINVYSLGKRLWEQVPSEQLFNISETEIDVSFLEQFYNKFTHEHEQISFVRKDNKSKQQFQSKDYKRVKEELIQYYLFEKPVLLINENLTNESGYLTLQYINEPYELSMTYLMKFKEVISNLLNEKIYMKPFTPIQYN